MQPLNLRLKWPPGQQKLTSPNPSRSLKASLLSKVLDFLLEKPQKVHFSKNTSNSIEIDTRVLQGCVFGPLLFILLAHECTEKINANPLIKTIDDITMILIHNKMKQSIRAKVELFV